MYNPREIVKYQVSRIDRVLREELGLADGLADPQVLVLDPCCGTGTYLIEVLEHIQRTHSTKGQGALVAAEVKKAAMTRVFGFEILPAPFVVSHLQLGLLLQRLGAPLQNQNSERVPVFLTNALTGWEPHKDTKKFAFPELEWEIAWTRNSHRGSHGSEPDGPQASRAGVAAAHVKRELPAGAQARLLLVWPLPAAGTKNIKA